MKRLVPLMLVVSACNCGDTKLIGVADHDAGTPAPTSCATGTVTGRACAPDDRTWISGADVNVEGTDCNGQPFDVTAQSDADGNFQLGAVPAGHRTVRLRSGQFSSNYDVDVVANQTTHIPDNQLCFAPETAKLAVVTGKGDHIEELLTGMGLSIDKKVDGTPTGWATAARPFLLDRSQLEQYDVLFLDCAAAADRGQIDTGSSSDDRNIAANLRDFVAAGGSVYASDWAFLFLNLAWPDQMPVLTHDSTAFSSPFDTNELMGFGQTVNATIDDAGLSRALGKTSLTVAFPQGHWALVSDTSGGATSLVSGTAKTCSSSSSHFPLDCDKAGRSAYNIPLALTFTPPADNPSRQGRVTYTTFHNISQPTGDVEKLLKYLIFHL